MTKKSGTSFAPPTSNKPIADAFVRGAESRSIPATAVKDRVVRPVRITIDLAPELHRRLKIEAVNRNQRVADIVREWVAENCQ